MFSFSEMDKSLNYSQRSKKSRTKIKNSAKTPKNVKSNYLNTEEGDIESVKHYFINSSDEDSFTDYMKHSSKRLYYNDSDNDDNYNKFDNSLNTETNKKYKNVFDRLTDTKFYTGIHKERFDELGNGRGLAGNEDIFLVDGWTETATRTHEVYSTVIKKNRSPVVTPGTLGIQKYGIQIATPKNIWLYRNGDKYHSGLLFLVKPYINNFNTLLFEITKVLSPIIGPVRKVYDQNFRVVKKIDQLVDGAKYLCTSGEPPAPLDKLEIFLSKWVIQE